MAYHRTELQLFKDRRVRSGLAPGAVASRGSRRPPGDVYPRLLAHHPRFSSGSHGGDAAVDAFWRALYEHDADVVLAGHDHSYERFAPQTPDGKPDPARGIRQFIVGTGGDRLRKLAGQAIANSEARNDETLGVLKLTLHPASYEWQFIPVAGGKFTDAGTGRCH